MNQEFEYRDNPWGFSDYWENIDIDRRKKQMSDYIKLVEEKGIPIILNGVKVEFSGDSPELSLSQKEIHGKKIRVCKFCKNTKPFSLQGSMVKIIDPNFPEGFLDKGGVWATCPHITRDPERENNTGKEKDWKKFKKG